MINITTRDDAADRTYAIAVEKLTIDLFGHAVRMIGAGFDPAPIRPDYMFESVLPINCAMHMVCDLMELTLGVDAIARQYEGLKRPGTRATFPSDLAANRYQDRAPYRDVRQQAHHTIAYYAAFMSSLSSEATAERVEALVDIMLETIAAHSEPLLAGRLTPAWIRTLRHSADLDVRSGA